MYGLYKPRPRRMAYLATQRVGDHESVVLTAPKTNLVRHWQVRRLRGHAVGRPSTREILIHTVDGAIEGRKPVRAYSFAIRRKPDVPHGGVGLALL